MPLNEKEDISLSQTKILQIEFSFRIGSQQKGLSPTALSFIVAFSEKNKISLMGSSTSQTQITSHCKHTSLTQIVVCDISTQHRCPNCSSTETITRLMTQPKLFLNLISYKAITGLVERYCVLLNY